MKALLQNQYHAAECHLRASTWRDLFTRDKVCASADAATREQLIGAYHSAQARKQLDEENALRAIEICLGAA